LSTGLDTVLGPPYASLAERIESDLADHVAELNERRRNLLTVRGLGITSVSALLAGTVASGHPLLAVVAIVIVVAFAYADLEANRRIQAIEKRIPFLEELSRLIRRSLALGSVRAPIVNTLKGRLRTYKRTPPGTDEVAWGISARSPMTLKPVGVRRPFVRAPGSFNIRAGLGAFVWIYAAMVLGCLVLGITTLSTPTTVRAVVSCVVPGGSNLRAAATDGRCGPEAQDLRLAKASCAVPSAISGSSFTIRCRYVHGVIAVEIQQAGIPVLTSPAAVGVDGRVAISVARLRRGRTYTVTLTDNESVLASGKTLTIG
jgi:hypothetical protein